MIVFDFIRGDVANEIFDQMVDALLNDVKSLGYVFLFPNLREPRSAVCVSEIFRTAAEAYVIKLKLTSSTRCRAP